LPAERREQIGFVIDVTGKRVIAPWPKKRRPRRADRNQHTNYDDPFRPPGHRHRALQGPRDDYLRGRPLPIVVAHHVQLPITQASAASATNATLQDVIQIRRERRASRGSRSR
jgi:hypothetical protein